MGRSASSWSQNGVRKGQWTPEEDQKLVEFMAQRDDVSKGCKWRNVPKVTGLNRCGKSCRLRWINYLRPGIKRGKYSQQEDETIIHLHSILGNKWSAIAKHLPGRTDNEIKNYWHADLTKRLVQKGIDPVTHQPRLHTDGLIPKNLDNLQYLLDEACNNAINNLIANPSQLRALRSQLIIPDHSNDIDKVIQMLNTILQLLKTSLCTSCSSQHKTILHSSLLCDHNSDHDPFIGFAPREPTYNDHVHYEQYVYGTDDVGPNLVSSQANVLVQEATNQVGTVALTPSVSVPMVSGLSECSRSKRKMNPNVNDVSNFSSTLETNWDELWCDDEAWGQFIK